MKPRNSVYVGGPPLDPSDDDEWAVSSVCKTCKGRFQVPFIVGPLRGWDTEIRWKDCPDCCNDL